LGKKQPIKDTFPGLEVQIRAADRLKQNRIHRVGRWTLSDYLFCVFLDFSGENLLFEYLELVAREDAGISVFADLDFVFEYGYCRAAGAFAAQFYNFHLSTSRYLVIALTVCPTSNQILTEYPVPPVKI